MGEDAERTARAGQYVSGAMDAVERERAEQDLASDPAFRDAVLRVAQQTGRVARPGDDRLWSEVATDLSALPQMRNALPAIEAGPREAAPAAAVRSAPWLSRLRIALLILAAVAFAAGFLAGRVSTGIF